MLALRGLCRRSSHTASQRSWPGRPSRWHRRRACAQGERRACATEQAFAVGSVRAVGESAQPHMRHASACALTPSNHRNHNSTLRARCCHAQHNLGALRLCSGSHTQVTCCFCLLPLQLRVHGGWDDILSWAALPDNDCRSTATAQPGSCGSSPDIRDLLFDCVVHSVEVNLLALGAEVHAVRQDTHGLQSSTATQDRQRDASFGCAAARCPGGRVQKLHEPPAVLHVPGGACMHVLCCAVPHVCWQRRSARVCRTHVPVLDAHDGVVKVHIRHALGDGHLDSSHGIHLHIRSQLALAVARGVLQHQTQRVSRD